MHVVILTHASHCLKTLAAIKNNIPPMAPREKLIVLSFTVYLLSTISFIWSAATYASLETTTQDIKITSSLNLEKQGYSCQMIATATPTANYYPPSSSVVLNNSVGQPITYPIFVDIGYTSTLFASKSECTSFVSSQAFTNSCRLVTSDGTNRNYGISCGSKSSASAKFVDPNAADFNGIAVDAYAGNAPIPSAWTNSCMTGSCMTQADFLSMKAQMLPYMITGACNIFPFPPYICQIQVKTKDFTPLGVLSLSVSNFQLIFGALTFIFASILASKCTSSPADTIERDVQLHSIYKQKQNLEQSKI
jgi:hypothetical protein